MTTKKSRQPFFSKINSDDEGNFLGTNPSISDDQRFLIVLVCSMVLIILLLVNLINRYFIFGTLSAPAVLAMLAVSLVPLFSPIKGRVRYSGIYLAGVGSILLPFAAYQEGGLMSVPVLWFPAIPLIAMFFSGIRAGLTFTTLIVFEVAVFWMIHENSPGIFSTVTSHRDPQMFRYAACAAIAVTFFSSCLAALSRLYESAAYRELSESENQFRLLASGIPVMVWRINKLRKLDFANRNLKLFLGRRDFDHLKTVIRNEDYRKVMTVFLDAWRKQAPFKVEFCCQDATNRVRWVSCTGVPRKFESRGFLGYVGVCIDITDRKTKEAALTAAKNKSEKENMAKSNYLASLSHEIRTPMGIIIGYTELLRENNSVPDDFRRHLDVVDRNAKHLLELLNNVLDLSKLEANSFQLDLKPVNIRKEILDTLEPFQFMAQRKSIQLLIHLDDSIPQRDVMLDPLQMRQIIVNLVSNAVKFTNKGEIRVKVMASVHSGMTFDEKPKRHFEIRVSDTGVGISPDETSLIFRPFVQAKGSEFLGGTGLGLALSQKLARIMGGDVFLEKSKPNRGSTFVFQFATEDASDATFENVPSSALVALPAHGSLLQGCRLLVADDVTENRVLLKTLLAEAGAEVELAGNGIEVLEQVSRSKFDLILMDIKMPLMDGLQTTRLLRKDGVTVPIVAHSAHTFSHERGDCIAAGCDDFISKPFSTQALVMKIKSLTQNHSMLH